MIGQTPGEFEIRYNVESLTTNQQNELQPTLASAADFCESVIHGYQPGVTLDGVDIDVSAVNIDGVDGALARASPLRTE